MLITDYLLLHIYQDYVLAYMWNNLSSNQGQKNAIDRKKALEKMKGNFINRLINPDLHEYNFIATAVENTQHLIKKSFLK